MKLENKKLEFAAFSSLLVVKWGMSDSRLFSQKQRFFPVAVSVEW